MAQRSERSDGADPAMGGGDALRGRLLVADDQGSNVVLLERVLAKAGYFDVDVTTDATQVVALIEERQPDLVLLDWHMPGRDGAGILATLRDGGPWSDLPVIVLTADPTVRLRALEMGASDFLVKPFDPVEVVLRIRHQLAVRGLQQQLQDQNVDLERRVRERTAELEAANVRLRELDEIRRDFVAMASHEMRTPLTVIGGLAEVLVTRAGELDAAESERFLGAVRRNVQRLERLVSNLLLASRIETAPRDHVSQEFDLAEVLGTAVDEVAPANDVSLTCMIDRPVRADPNLVTQVVENLLVNAQRYGAPPIEVRAAGIPDAVEVTVADRGPGVPDAFVPHLFQRFSQATTGDRRTAQGVGLGLWISQQLVNAQGGELWYEPRPSGGAVFGFRLPNR